MLYVLFYDLRHVLRLDKSIPDRLRIDHHRRPMLALVQAPGLIGAHSRLQARGADSFLEQPLQLSLAIRRAAATSAARFPLVGADE
jgi:hypothetical protein